MGTLAITMINVEHITKEFGNKAAVSDVTFSVEKGEILGFLGPNGAGKTTTMRMLAGIFPPTSGSARIAGFDVVEQSMETRKRIGYLPEQIPLYPELTVSQYLDFVASLWSYNRSERNKRTENVLSQCNLVDVRDRLLGRISRGYRQRVGLAQALIHDPEVLILDEPTVGLDPKQIREIRQLIKSFQGEKTVILSTHILPEVSMTCQKVVIINQGKVVAQGTPESLTHGANSMTQIEVLVQGPPQEVSATLSAISGVRHVEVLGQDPRNSTRLLIRSDQSEIRPEIARTVVTKNWGLLEMQLRSLTLEDVFVNLITKETLE